VYPGHSEIKTKLNGTQRTIDEWNKTKTYSFPQQRDVSSSCDEKVNNECCVMKTMELSYQPWKDDQNAKLYSIGNPFTTLAQQQNILLERLRKLQTTIDTKEATFEKTKEEYELQAERREQLFDTLKKAFHECMEAVQEQNRLNQAQYDNAVDLESSKQEKEAFEKLLTHCQQLLRSYQQFQQEMKTKLSTLDEQLSDKWKAFEKKMQ